MALNRLIAVLPPQTVAASGNSATYTNRDGSGIIVVVKNTAGTGTSPTVTVKLQEFYPGAGWVDVAGMTTTALAAGTPATTTLVMRAGLTASANAAVNRQLGRVWRLVWTIGGSASPTVSFSVDACIN